MLRFRRMPAASIGRRTDMFFQIEGYTRFLLNPPNQTKGRTFQNVRPFM